MTVFLSYLLFPDERNGIKVILAFIAALAVLSLSLNKSSLKIDTYSLLVFVAAIFWSFQAIVSKVLLETFNPVTLAFLRAFFITIILLLFVRVTFSDVKGNIKYFVFLAIIDTVSIVFLFWSYQSIGIVETTIFFSLYPVISEWLASVFLKEKLRWRNIVVTAIIVGCIIFSQLM